MLKGFKDFLLRGNVIDLAVAVVIGTAFTSFFAVAAVVYFVFVLPMNTFKKHVEARKGTAAEQPQEEPAAATEAELLVEIRDLLARNQRNDAQ